MNDMDHCPSVRLALAGVASLVLLGWITLLPGAMLPGTDLATPFQFFTLFITAGLSLFIFVTLIPVICLGPGRDRWLAVLAAVFPILVLASSAFGVLQIKF